MAFTDEEAATIFVTEAECCDCSNTALTVIFMSTNESVCRDCYDNRLNKMGESLSAEFSIEKGRPPTFDDFALFLVDTDSFVGGVSSEIGGVKENEIPWKDRTSFKQRKDLQNMKEALLASNENADQEE